MATFVIGEDTVRMEKQRKEMENLEKSRRHYKKDSRFIQYFYLSFCMNSFSFFYLVFYNLYGTVNVVNQKERILLMDLAHTK